MPMPRFGFEGTRRSGPCVAFVSAWLACCVAIAADTDPGAPREDLDVLLRGMATTSGLIAPFSEVKHLALLSMPLEVRGTLYFAPPDRLVRVTEAPSPSRLLIDGERFAFRNEAGGDEVSLRDDPIARAFVENFVVLFNGDRAALEARYALDFESSGERWTLVLRPRGRPLSELIARVTLAGERRMLDRIDLVETNGDRTTTVFEGVVLDHRFAEGELERIFAGPGAGATEP